MAKAKTVFECTECGWTTAKWLGQCRDCSAWGTMVETIPVTPADLNRPTLGGALPAITPKAPALAISQVGVEEARFRSSGVGELDRVLGGGIVPGAVILMAGDPGIGKSTLLLDVAGRLARNTDTPSKPPRPKENDSEQRPVLYLTGEESASQVRLRADRIGALADQLFLASETELEAILGQIQAVKPQLVIIDSVQTIGSAQVEGQPGGVNQVRSVTQALIAVAKRDNIPMFLVGHVTKSGGIAGPRVLEHLVDVVCQFEGDRHTRLRMLRAIKNRYGPTDEVGCFELGDRGIMGLADPSGLFLSQSNAQIPGTCVTVTLEGRRPMPTEIQALVAPVVNGGSARRTTSGLDYSRVAMTLAVLQARLRLPLVNADIYVSTVGGAKTGEPAADLAVAVAVASAQNNKPCLEKMIAIGEVSLTGEVRATVGVQQRLSEAARLGFKTALVPRSGFSDLTAPAGMKLIAVTNLAEAVMHSLPES